MRKRRSVFLLTFVTLILLTTACRTERQAIVEGDHQPGNEEQAITTDTIPNTQNDPSLTGRVREKWTGDLDGMIERRFIRVLVTYNRTYYFYDGAEARGISYEALKEFEKFLNAKLKTGSRSIAVVFIPVQRGDMFAALVDGRGDIAASNIAITPEGQAIVDYSDPVSDVSSTVVITGPNSPAINSIDDLSGNEVYVRRNSRYWFALKRLNDRLVKSGKPPIIMVAADANLEDEDVLEMVNAGIVGITVVDGAIAGLWDTVFENIILHTDVKVGEDVAIGWAFRKNSPQLASVLNEFVKDHKVGTSYGNTLLRRYFQNPKWIVNATSDEERRKFEETVTFFKKYSNEYGFDWLMVAAQAYQESRLEQSARSAAGAVGVMQIKPSTAAGSPINIKDVEKLEPNIHAGIKYMRFIVDQYFKDPSMDRINKGLFAFASYNAGPNRIASLRRQAKDEGLDPDKWFNNVELIAGRELGVETVTYVGNIYKYYIAFKLVNEHNRKKKSAPSKK